MLYNINPKIWGRFFWGAMHYVTIAYPNDPTQEDKEHVRDFFNIIKYVLPCEKCRYHYSDNLQKFPLTDDVLSNRYNLINFIRTLHNEVNARHGKKQYTYDEVIAQYENKNNSCTVEIVTVILLILILTIIIWYIKFSGA